MVQEESLFQMMMWEDLKEHGWIISYPTWVDRVASNWELFYFKQSQLDWKANGEETNLISYCIMFIAPIVTYGEHNREQLLAQCLNDYNLQAEAYLIQMPRCQGQHQVND